MSISLQDALRNIPDPRRGQGRRVTIEQLFSMVIISYLCGHVGYRPVARFCKAHAPLLIKSLGLRHGIPSYVTFRDVLMRVDEQALIRAFNRWAASFAGLNAGMWVSGDGKSLRSTVSEQATKAQDFVSVVSLFCQESGLVAMIGTFRNKKASEIEILKAMIDYLEAQGLIIRMDALHTQKNITHHQ